MNASNPIKLLIVDYMALARKILSEGLATPSIDVVATASDPWLAEKKFASTKPHVILLDVRPPVHHQAQWLREVIERRSTPIVLLTSLDPTQRRDVVESLRISEDLVLSKPPTGIAKNLSQMLPQIEAAVFRAHRAQRMRWQELGRPAILSPVATKKLGKYLIAIGASTGGTDALSAILSQLPRCTPGIAIVLHMPSGFTRTFAERIDKISELDVKEAVHGDVIAPGCALLAPGGQQMRVCLEAGSYTIKMGTAEKVSGHCPSVDVLMRSVAEQAGPRGIGIMLTGMGRDGAEGMLAMRKRGARTIAQDAASSVVFGMPREAFRRGAVQRLLPLGEIAREIGLIVEKQA